MVTENIASLQGGNVGHPHHGDSSTSTHVFMSNETVSLTTRAKTSETSLENNVNGGTMGKLCTSTTPLSSPLQIEQPIYDSMLHPLRTKVKN